MGFDDFFSKIFEMRKHLRILFITLLAVFINCQSYRADNTYFAED